MRSLRLLVVVLLAATALASPAAAVTPTVSIAVSSLSPVYGSAVTVSGRVTHVPKGTNVVLQRNLGTGWVYTRLMHTSSTGAYATTYSSTLGQNHLRIAVASSGSRPRVISTQLVVAAQPRLTPRPPVAGQPVVVDGRLRTAGARPIDLEISRDGAVTKVSGRTDSTGTFAISTTLASSSKLRVVAPPATDVSAANVLFTTPWRTVEVALQRTEKPRIQGSPVVGSTLTTVTGTWDAGVTFACQWLRDGDAISGATTCSRAVTNADAGTHLAVRVTGSKPGWAPVSSTSDQTVVVTGGSLSPTPTPTITGEAEVGGHLTAASGSWGPGVSLTYQWRRSGTVIPDADGASYDPVAADVDHRLTVTVTGSRPGFNPASRTSDQTEPVARSSLESATPVVSGTDAPGETLTVAPGTWGPGPVQLTYRWLRDDVAIPGATVATYTLTDADRGSLIAAEVTGAKDGYAMTTRRSARRAIPGPQSPSKIARALTTFHAALGRVDEEPLDIFVGPSDSLADGARATSIQKRWISVFRDDLRAVHQPAGVPGGFGYLDPFNWGQFPDNPISYVNGAGVFEQGLGLQTLALFGSTQTITLKDTFTDADILYSGWAGSAGAFTYSVDGGSEKRVETGGRATTKGGYVERISGLAAGPHEVVIRGAGGGAGNPAIVEGVMIYNGDLERGVRVWEGGASARRALDYVAPHDAWATSLSGIHPDLVVLPIGSNDFAIGVPAADTEARLREIIATIRSHVDTDPSIVLMPYYDRPAGGDVTWEQYEEMYARIAATDPDIAVFDLEPLFGAYGSVQRSGLMAFDHIHPSDTGYALIAQKLAEFLDAN